MASYAHETLPCLGAANCESVATFVGSWEVHRIGVLRTSELDLAVSGGATCELVAILAGSWEVPRSGDIRTSEWDLADPEGCEP